MGLEVMLSSMQSLGQNDLATSKTTQHPWFSIGDPS